MHVHSFGEVAHTYDAIAGQYRKTKHLALQDQVNRYTLFQLAGDLSGKNVLDLACGEGHYTRMLKEAGACRTLGVDISPAQIQRALEVEKSEPTGCRYRVADVSDLNFDCQFDLATGVYLLNYASSRAQLLSLCQAIANALKPGGKFIGINTNMALDPRHYDSYRKYGHRLSSPTRRAEGDVIGVHLNKPDGTEVSFDNYYLSPKTYEAAFKEAGFQSFEWVSPMVSPEGKAARESGYWDTLLRRPPMIFIKAVR
ncbi:MAG: class I SAM-dependent methyltransferase [Stappiaceae bacterium]